jgi:hypothetical protein
MLNTSPNCDTTRRLKSKFVLFLNYKNLKHAKNALSGKKFKIIIFWEVSLIKPLI